MNYKKGFTLIELLVVIAIIGILSSVVLASLNTARDKGADAAVKANLNGMRAQAELYYDTNTQYNSAYAANCTSGVFSDPNMTSALNSANSANGGNAAATCTSSTTGWAAYIPLKSTGFYCVDGNGNATTSAAALTITDGICN